VSVKDYFFLVIVDGRLFDVWIQVVVPSFSALFTGATSDFVDICQLLSNERPPLGAVLRHEANN
jgi:hypothetical protein